MESFLLCMIITLEFLEKQCYNILGQYTIFNVFFARLTRNS